MPTPENFQLFLYWQIPTAEKLCSHFRIGAGATRNDLRLKTGLHLERLTERAMDFDLLENFETAYGANRAVNGGRSSTFGSPIMVIGPDCWLGHLRRGRWFI